MAAIANPVPVPAPARRKFSWQKFIANLFGTPLTAEEKAERRNLKILQRNLALKDAMLKKECEDAAALISFVLADLGICWSKEHKGKTLTRRVKFKKHFAYSEEALYLPVDLGAGQRPTGVGVKQLRDPETLEDLSLSVGRKIEARYSERIGFVYVVWRDQSARGIPDHVKYDDMIALRPASMGALAFPLGMGEGRSRHWHNFSKRHAIGIYGESGGGKSNQVNVMIATLVSQCSPAYLKIALVDLKRVELSLYKKLPHVMQYKDPRTEAMKAGYVYETEDAANLLESVITEMERRYGLLEGEELRNIGEYNARHKARALPYILIVVDEFADLASDKKFGPRFHAAMERIARIGRACGVCIALCTQHPNKEVLSMGIRVNLPTTLAFSVGNLNASVSVIGNSRAYSLSDKPGRFIYKAGPVEREVQAAFISTDKVKEILDVVKGGKRYHADVNVGHDVSDQEIFAWALASNDGYLSIPSVTKQFSQRGLTERGVRTFVDHYKGKTVMVEGTEYLVRAGGQGIATRLVAIGSDSQPATGSAEGPQPKPPENPALTP